MYDVIAPSYNALHGEEQRRKLQRLLAAYPLRPGMKVLDVGCGTAHLATAFSQQEYTGVDPSTPLLRQAPPGTRVRCAHGEDLPFPDNSFDVVLSLTALHNYEDVIAGVDELYRVAKDAVLVGVLRKSASHDLIVRRLKEIFFCEQELVDQHDTLLILRKP